MRSQGNIRQQLKQVIYRHLQRRLRSNFKQRPDTCRHNRQIPLGEESYVSLCGILSPSGEPRNVPCDSRIPGCDAMARVCPLWEPTSSKEEVKASFYALLHSGDRGLIAAEYPDIAALMWVLDDPAEVPSVQEIEEVKTSGEVSDLDQTRTLWQRLGLVK